MQRKRLVASVAAAPLLILAHGALAEVTITDAQTTPKATATAATGPAADSIKVTSTGSIKPTVAGPALLLNSDHDITNEGVISTTDVDGSVGMQADDGFSGIVTNKGQVSIIEDYTPADNEASTGGDDEIGDGEPDGTPGKEFATGTGRAGIFVDGSVTGFTGAIINSGSITVEGNNSYGVRIVGDFLSGAATGHTGTFSHTGSIAVTGNDSVGVSVTGGVVEGSLDLRGSVGVLGEDAIAVDVSSDVDGVVRIQGAVSARGYRYSTRPADPAALALLDADDLLQGGGGVRIAGNVGQGVIIDTGPTTDEDEDVDDEDGDGVDDAAEGTGSITVYGSKPALLIGSETASTVIGKVAATGDDAYGLVMKGTIGADGVYDDVSATAIQIGGGGTATATLAGGMRLDGTVTARAFDDDATAVLLNGTARLGANGTGALVNDGVITAQSIAKSATSILEEANKARGVWIKPNTLNGEAVATSLTNSGQIIAQVNGENGTAIAIDDDSGRLTWITNTGRIQAVVLGTDDASDLDDSDTDGTNEERGPGSRTIAIDVSAATVGVTITQTGREPIEDDTRTDTDGDGVADADEPRIDGDIDFGSGDDTLSLENGVMVGDANFGAGQNTLKLDGGAIMQGWLTNSGSGLDINIADGILILNKTETITGRDLDVGAEGALYVTVDTEAQVATKLVVDTANFAEGARIGLDVRGLIDFETLGGTESYLIIDAGELTLGAGGIDNSLIDNSPYIYNIGIDANTTTDEVNLNIRRRTAAEAGMNAAEGAAFDAVYEVLGQDEGLRNAILAQQTREGFLGLYDQLLPDQGEGLFSALDMGQISIARAIATKPDLRQRYGPDSVWIQELNLQVKRDGGETLGSEAKAIGFVAGYESMGDDGGALGATLAYITAEENDDAAKVGEQTTVSQLEGGVYWRRATGSWLFSLRGGGGYAWFDGTRRFIYPGMGLIREANAEWGGITGSAHAGAQYEQRFGRFYARPGAFLDYFYLREDEREEEGGGGLNQTVEGRTSYRLSGTAEVALGAEFGRDFWWRPEVRLGYRQVLAGEIGDTVASFAGGDSFTLAAMEPGNGAAIVALALKMGTPMSYLALEGEMEAADGEQRYNLKLTGRVMF